MATLVTPVSTGDLGTPLLGTSGRTSRGSGRRFQGVLSCPGLRSEKEAQKVFTFLFAAFLANSFFVAGKNVGTVLFLSVVGPEHLTTAIASSGLCSVVFGQAFSNFSRSRTTTVVNGVLCVGGAGLTALLFLGAMTLPTHLPSEGGLEWWAVVMLYFGIYISEDILTMFVAMQSASVAQSFFSVSDAKRLFGKVTLGNSLAAMSVGMIIGDIAKAIGTVQLLAVQSLLLLASAMVNGYIAKSYADQAMSWKKKRRRAGCGDSSGEEPWWRNLLVLAMGLWSFTVIFTKTMYEYQYNVVAAQTLTAPDMVTITGYLYAGAGIASTLINISGTDLCLATIGMRGAILATPLALLVASAAILTNLSVTTTFVGRLVDLSLRWSLNNTVRTVLWIAVPAQQAATAKPWVEGTVKKMGQVFNAAVISVALAIGGLRVLSLLSVGFCAILFVCCIRVYDLYLQSMWFRVKRREMNHTIIEDLPDQRLRNDLKEKLLHGGTLAQLDILFQMGENFSDEDWEHFFQCFYDHPTAVQLAVMQLGRKQAKRVRDVFLLGLMDDLRIEPSVLQVAILCCGDRKLHGAVASLQTHLGHMRPSVRAAAAVAILNIGWGAGLGDTTKAALTVLEAMLGFPLEGPLRVPSDNQHPSMSRALRSVLASRGLLGCSADAANTEPPDAETLINLEQVLTKDWEAALNSGDVAKAIGLALQLTHVKAATRCGVGSNMMTMVPYEEVSSRMPRPISQGDETERCQNLATALQMVKAQQLPELHELVPIGRWYPLLAEESSRVREAALAFVLDFVRECEENVEEYVNTLKPDLMEEFMGRLIQCLYSSATYNSAEETLHRLERPEKVQELVLKHLEDNLKQHSDLVGRDSEDRSYETSSVRMLQLLKFLRRQLEWWTEANCDPPLAEITPETLRTLQQGQASNTVCDMLLGCSKSLHDADVLQELFQTMVDLKDQGFAIEHSLVARRIEDVAISMCKALSMKRWMGQRKSEHFNDDELNKLRFRLELHGAEDAFERRNSQEENQELATHIFKIGKGYIDEKVYLGRLQLLQLSILAVPKMPASYRSTRVLAAWRLLREQDSESEAAVMEVLDSMLSIYLKQIVLPLLDSSPLEKKLAVGVSLSQQRQENLKLDEGTSPPEWMVDWFKSTGSALGVELAKLFAGVVDSQKACVSPSKGPNQTLLAKMVLLSEVRMYSKLLSSYLAEVAIIASVEEYKEGSQLGDPSSTYVVAYGTFCDTAGEIRSSGSVLQELHSICKELPASSIKCISPGGGIVLRISRDRLFALQERLQPKFALSLLRALVVQLPAPQQTGASKVNVGPPSTKVMSPRSTVPRTPEAATRMFRLGTADLPQNADLPQYANVERLLQSPSTAALASDAPDGLEELERSARAGSFEDMDLLEPEGADKRKRLEDENHDQGQDGGHHPANNDLAYSDRRVEPFTTLEMLVLLQGVKIFRYVQWESLQSLTKCCSPDFKKAGSIICLQGHATDATLYIVAEGEVGLYKGCMGLPRLTSNGSRGGSWGVLNMTQPPSEFGETNILQRKLGYSDTLGNTGLLCDGVWNYTARAVQDTWLLCITRRDLTDMLRGRRDLASAVIRGLYKTFTRRIQSMEGHPAPAHMAITCHPRSQV